MRRGQMGRGRIVSYIDICFLGPLSKGRQAAAPCQEIGSARPPGLVARQFTNRAGKGSDALIYHESFFLA